MDGSIVIGKVDESKGAVGYNAANGKIYVIGGQTTESSEPDKAGFVNTVYEHDPATGKWAVRAPMPTMRARIERSASSR
mgnify:CR=1 FL=1